MAGKTIALFDVDGTLTAPRQAAKAEMLKFLQDLRKHVKVGIVGGSDASKIKEQLGADAASQYDFFFAENGLVAYQAGQQVAVRSITDELGEAKLQEFINFCLHYIADLEIPVKRGTFIEFRNGMLNVSPIGRNCRQEERDAFEAYDKEKGIRRTMVEALQAKFPELPFKYSIGGQISFDAFPKGWDKTYCLQFLDDFETIHFFGDKTYEGGNDFEIFSSDRTQGHTVNGPDDTMRMCRDLFLNSN